mmetsp:Transcript_109781/g.153836  ORF Transcript_109781/g.153836 Transcript_109781/m.153836 type:complete len:245 (+) Transcript_109781:1391-2125(+)
MASNMPASSPPMGACCIKLRPFAKPAGSWKKASRRSWSRTESVLSKRWARLVTASWSLALTSLRRPSGICIKAGSPPLIAVEAASTASMSLYRDFSLPLKVSTWLAWRTRAASNAAVASLTSVARADISVARLCAEALASAASPVSSWMRAWPSETSTLFTSLFSLHQPRSSAYMSSSAFCSFSRVACISFSMSTTSLTDLAAAWFLAMAKGAKARAANMVRTGIVFNRTDRRDLAQSSGSPLA